MTSPDAAAQADAAVPAPCPRPLRRVADLCWEPRLVLLVYLLLTVQFVLGGAGTPAHHRWAVIALPGYAVALVVALVLPRRPLVSVAVCLVATVVVPLVSAIASGLAQSEVLVVRAGAHAVLHTGDFYVTDPAQVHVYTDYRPYLPTLFGFGLPSQVPGLAHVLDPRVLGLAVVLAAVAALCLTGRRGAVGLAGPGGQYPRLVGLGLLLCYPTVALLTATSFIDLPQAALTLLTLVLLDRRRGPSDVAAGVVLGLALDTKPTEVAVLFVLLLWLHHVDGLRRATRLLLTSVATALVVVVPFLLVSPHAMYTNVVLYPTGRTAIVTPAQSSLPGALLERAVSGTAWSWLPTAVLLVVGLAFAVLCVRRPPASLLGAAVLLSVGLSLAFLLAPQTRTGYFVIPLLVLGPAAIVDRPPSRVPGPVRA